MDSVWYTKQKQGNFPLYESHSDSCVCYSQQVRQWMPETFLSSSQSWRHSVLQKSAPPFTGSAQKWQWPVEIRANNPLPNSSSVVRGFLSIGSRGLYGR